MRRRWQRWRRWRRRPWWCRRRWAPRRRCRWRFWRPPFVPHARMFRARWADHADAITLQDGEAREHPPTKCAASCAPTSARHADKPCICLQRRGCRRGRVHRWHRRGRRGKVKCLHAERAELRRFVLDRLGRLGNCLGRCAAAHLNASRRRAAQAPCMDTDVQGRHSNVEQCGSQEKCIQSELLQDVGAVDGDHRHGRRS